MPYFTRHLPNILSTGGIKFFVDLGFDRWEFNTQYQDDVANGEAHEVTLTRNQQTIQMQVRMFVLFVPPPAFILYKHRHVTFRDGSRIYGKVIHMCTVH